MKLRNLIINDANVQNKDMVVDGIHELELIILNNYDLIKKREVAIEFNVGAKLGRQSEHIVVYSNPAYKNNPYVFILKKDANNNMDIYNKTDLTTFQSLSDLYVRKDVFHVLVKNLERVPAHLFLSQEQIKNARQKAKEYDISL